MARTAKITVHFVTDESEGRGYRIGPRSTFRDYVVELRQGRRCWSVGRISGSVRNGRGAWNGLPIGADAWTRWHRTRADALAALQARETFTDETTWITR